MKITGGYPPFFKENEEAKEENIVTRQTYNHLDCQVFPVMVSAVEK